MQLLWGGHDWWEKVEAESQWPHGSENDCSLAKERKEVDKEGRKDWLKCDHILCPWKLLSSVKQETEGQEAKHNYLIRKSRWENFRSHQDVQKKKKKEKTEKLLPNAECWGVPSFSFPMGMQAWADEEVKDGMDRTTADFCASFDQPSSYGSALEEFRISHKVCKWWLR